MKTTTVAIIAFAIMAGAAQAEVCPVTINKKDGLHATCTDPQKGDPGEKGEQGEKGDKGDQGVAGLDGKDGFDGKDGADGKDGRDGKDFDPSEYQEGLATIGALHIPHVEKNFAASLTGGFYNDKTAVGIGAGIRFDQTWQFGGSLAIGTDGGDIAGKGALTGQW